MGMALGHLRQGALHARSERRRTSSFELLAALADDIRRHLMSERQKRRSQKVEAFGRRSAIGKWRDYSTLQLTAAPIVERLAGTNSREARPSQERQAVDKTDWE